MIRLIVKIVLPLLVLGIGVAAGLWFYLNPDEAKKRPRPEAQALLVETGQAEQGEYKAQIEVMGQIIPATAATLKPQIAGEILEIAPEFVPGGFFEQGAVILSIDPADYKLAVQKQEAILKQARADYELEMGRQSIARDELAIIERTTGHKPENPDLALRGPQLAQARAELDKVKVDLEAAKLDLQRTEIKAPFNALVTERHVTLGDKVTTAQALATLVRTDEYWAKISVPVHELKWLEIPRKAEDQGSPAQIILDGGRGERTGQLVKLTGALDSASRLATLLVSILNPLSLDEDKPALIIGDYAKVVLHGKPLENALRVPLSWVRNNSEIWVKEDGKLVFRPVQIVYSDRDYAYIGEGLSVKDSVVTSDIAVPVEAMKIRTLEEARADVQDRMKGAKGPKDMEKGGK